MVADDPETFADLDGHCCIAEGADVGFEVGSIFGPLGEAIGTVAGAGVGALVGSKVGDYVASHPEVYANTGGMAFGDYTGAQTHLYDQHMQKVDQQTKQDVKNDANGKCEYCGKTTQDAQKSQKGVTPPDNEGQTDHYKPTSKDGSDDKSNLAHACRTCNGAKSDSDPTNPNDAAGKRWQLDRMKNKQPQPSQPSPPQPPPPQPPVPNPAGP
jgi:5-methylcytosine-specific restriction endonuclease McrA